MLNNYPWKKKGELFVDLSFIILRRKFRTQKFFFSDHCAFLFYLSNSFYSPEYVSEYKEMIS